MSPLSAWRREARSLIGAGFLRRDQGDALFVSDFPRRGDENAAERLKNAGFTVVETARGLARVDASEDKYRILLSGLPAADPAPSDDTLYLYALAKQIEKSGAPFSPDALALLRAALKAMDGGDAAGLCRLLSPAFALALRRKKPLPAALGTLVLLFLSENGEE